MKLRKKATIPTIRSSEQLFKNDRLPAADPTTPLCMPKSQPQQLWQREAEQTWWNDDQWHTWTSWSQDQRRNWCDSSCKRCSFSNRTCLSPQHIVGCTGVFCPVGCAALLFSMQACSKDVSESVSAKLVRKCADRRPTKNELCVG